MAARDRWEVQPGFNIGDVAGQQFLLCDTNTVRTVSSDTYREALKTPGIRLIRSLPWLSPIELERYRENLTVLESLIDIVYDFTFMVPRDDTPDFLTGRCLWGVDENGNEAWSIDRCTFYNYTVKSSRTCGCASERHQCRYCTEKMSGYYEDPTRTYEVFTDLQVVRANELSLTVHHRSRGQSETGMHSLTTS